MTTPAASTPLDPQAKPLLPRGIRLKHDTVRDEWVLLAPERMIKLNLVSVEILKRCNGLTSLAGIIDELASTFAAPRERIAADVEVMLGQLVAKRLVDLT